MAHPMAAGAKTSQKRRLGYLRATAGKAWGSVNAYKKSPSAYPKKNAGTQREFTIEGVKGRKRADRAPHTLKLRDGGSAVRTGSAKRKGHTTNIVISAPGGAGGGGGHGGRHPGMPMPLPVNRPVPVPVGAGAAPMAAPMGGGALPVRPMGMPMGAAPMGGGLGGAPIVRPPIGAGGAPPALPPPGMKRGGAVKGKARGGEVQETRRAYSGYPHSPTSETESALSAHKRGGRVKKRAAGGVIKKPGERDDDEDEDEVPPAGQGVTTPTSAQATGQALASSQAPSVLPGARKRGGKVKKRQVGGILMGTPRPGINAPTQAQRAPTISGFGSRPVTPSMVPAPNTLASARARPAPGTIAGFKRGGRSRPHGDEAEDKRLFKKMFKQEEAKEEKTNKKEGKGEGAAEDTVMKRKDGGFVAKEHVSRDPGLIGPKYHDWGEGYARGGLVGGAGSGLGRIRKSRVAAKVPAKTELKRGGRA